MSHGRVKYHIPLYHSIEFLLKTVFDSGVLNRKVSTFVYHGKKIVETKDKSL